MQYLRSLFVGLVVIGLAACAPAAPEPTVVIPTLAQLPTATTDTAVVDGAAPVVAVVTTQPLPTPVPTSSIGLRIDGLFQGTLQAANGDTVAQALVSFTQIGDELTGNFLFTDAGGALIEVEARGSVTASRFPLPNARLLVGDWALFSDSTCEVTFNFTYTVDGGSEQLTGTLAYATACAEFAPASSARGGLTLDLSKATGA
jgi:hypothetical protein